MPLVFPFVVLRAVAISPFQRLQRLLRELMREQGWHLLRQDVLSEEWTEIILRTDVIKRMEMGGIWYHKLEPIAARRECADLSGAFQDRGRKVDHHWLWLTLVVRFLVASFAHFSLKHSAAGRNLDDNDPDKAVLGKAR